MRVGEFLEFKGGDGEKRLGVVAARAGVEDELVLLLDENHTWAYAEPALCAPVYSPMTIRLENLRLRLLADLSAMGIKAGAMLAALLFAMEFAA